MEDESKVPKDLKRWLKDNGYWYEFKILIEHGPYKVSDLTYKVFDDYGIKHFFVNIPLEDKTITLNGKNYSFLKFLKEFF